MGKNVLCDIHLIQWGLYAPLNNTSNIPLPCSCSNILMAVATDISAETNENITSFAISFLGKVVSIRGQRRNGVIDTQIWFKAFFITII